MATLEIHDGRNQVRRVLISHENPVMFGSDPMCDVVLDGPGVQPFHGRIRWKNERFKVDASPEVPWIEVNGVQVKSKSIDQGDELRIGRCRIFLISVDDGPDHGEKTVVRETPQVPKKAQTQARPGPSAAVEYHRMEMAPPSEEKPKPREVDRGGSPQKPLKRSGRRSSKLDFEDDEIGDLGRLDPKSLKGLMKKADGKSSESKDANASKPKAKKRNALSSLFSFADRAPGDDSVAGSPLVIGSIVAIVILVLFSIGLFQYIKSSEATRIYTVAMDDMEAGNYLNAIKNFDEFIRSNMKDKRAGKARVLRALAKVRQHTGSAGASWGNAMTEARAMVKDVSGIEEYRDSSLDLAEDIRKAAEGLADRAAEIADPKSLSESESALLLHAKVAGQGAASLIERSRIPAKLEKARAAIQKSKERVEALAAIDRALKASKPGDAYASRDALIRLYPDLAPDKELTSRLIQANELIKKAVSYDTTARPGLTEPRRDSLGPPTSLVLRLDPVKAPVGNNGPFAYALADGSLYGVDANTGTPRWQVPIGLSSPFPPLAVAGDPPSVIVADSRTNELVRINGKTGSLLWRQELGGSVADAPLILGNQVFQPTLDGRLLQLDLATGSLRGTLNLGRRVARTPVADDSVQHLYLLAEEHCVFVLTLDPLSCVGVEYLGHELASVACPPARVGRFYVLPENLGLNQGRWRVFVIDESGTKLKQVQEMPIGGWTQASPAASGPVIWSCSDRGELIAFAVGNYDAKVPFTQIARVAAGQELEGPAFPRAKTERDFWLASSRSGRFELDLERGRFSTGWTLGEAGPALAPPQAFDRVLVLSQQYSEGGGTALWGVDPNSGQVRWRTVLGAPWPIGLVSSSSGDALSVLGVDGKTLSIGLDSLRKGGFIEQPLPKPGTFRLPSSMAQWLEIDGATVVVPEVGASRILVRSGSTDFRPIELPGALATSAIPLGKNLLIPAADGRVYLIDPKTGIATADPYVPPFDRSKPIRWRTPVALEGDAIAISDSEATLRRISVDTTGRPRIAVTAEQKLDKPLAADPASTGASVLIVTTDGRVRSLGSRDLGPQGSWPLEGTRLMGPVVVSGHAFVGDSSGNVLAFSLDGRRLWSAKLRDTIASGPPAVLDQSVWFLGRDGSVQQFSLADGSPQSRSLLDCLPAGGALAAGTELLIPSGIGSVRVLDRKNLDNSEGTKP